MGGSSTAAGQKLGRYQIVKHLASGGMAEVLLARATGIEGFTRHVVIKRIRPGQAKDQAFVQMFLNEARLAAQLHHANIVQVHDIGQEGNEYFFAMEYVHGEDLRRLLTHVARNRAKVPLEHVVTIISAAAVALHHAHEQRGSDRKPLGIVHRDVTPANILVGYDGNVKVVDFGIAKAAARSEETQAGTLKGKASYMAPEQCTGGKVDRRSDVFALGIVLYELVTTRRLFKAENDFLTMSAIVAGKVPPARDHRPDLPAGLDAIITKALASRPEDRYQSADEMREALEHFAASASLRTSTSSLATYMKQQFGVRPEPWLIEEEDDGVEMTVDFEVSSSAVVAPPDESLHQLAIPLHVEARQSSPIIKARVKAITNQPKQLPTTVGVTKAKLPLAPSGLPTTPRTRTAQIPAAGAASPSDKSRPFRLDSAPVPVVPRTRTQPITVQIPSATQTATVPASATRRESGALPGVAPSGLEVSTGVPERAADAIDSDSVSTVVADDPKSIDSDWDLSAPVATGSSTNMAAVEQPAASSKPKASASGTKPGGTPTLSVQAAASPTGTSTTTEAATSDAKAADAGAAKAAETSGAGKATDAKADTSGAMKPASSAKADASGAMKPVANAKADASGAMKPAAKTRAKGNTSGAVKPASTAKADASDVMKPAAAIGAKPTDASGAMKPAAATGAKSTDASGAMKPDAKAGAKALGGVAQIDSKSDATSIAGASTTAKSDAKPTGATANASDKQHATPVAATKTGDKSDATPVPAATKTVDKKAATPLQAAAKSADTKDAMPLPAAAKSANPKDGAATTAETNTNPLATNASSGAKDAHAASSATPNTDASAAPASPRAQKRATTDEPTFVAVTKTPPIPFEHVGAPAAAAASAAPSSAKGATGTSTTSTSAASTSAAFTSATAPTAATATATTAATDKTRPPASAAGAATSSDKRWSLAELAAMQQPPADKNDQSQSSKFDVASLSSSRTDASSLDTPISGTATAKAAGDAIPEPLTADNSRDSAPSLPPPPVTRKSIRLPGIASLPGDEDPNDPVIDPPPPLMAGIGTHASTHNIVAKGPALDIDIDLSSPLRGGLLATPKRLAIVGGALLVVIVVIAFAMRSSDPKPTAHKPEVTEPVTPTQIEPALVAPAATPSDDELGNTDTAATTTSATTTPAITTPATAKPATTPATTTKPTASKPATTKPAATVTKPATTATTKPATTATTKPVTTATTKPVTTATTKPVTTATTKPATAKPATVTKPATTATTKPATTATSKPAATKPATVTKPATTATKPTTTRPTATTKPAITKPATTKPATTKPGTTTKPATKPATTKKPNWDPNSLFPKKK